jgi:hypothetical protein
MKDYVQNGNAVTYMFISLGSNHFWRPLPFFIRASPQTLVFSFFLKREKATSTKDETVMV